MDLLSGSHQFKDHRVEIERPDIASSRSGLRRKLVRLTSGLTTPTGSDGLPGGVNFIGARGKQQDMDRVQ